MTFNAEVIFTREIVVVYDFFNFKQWSLLTSVHVLDWAKFYFLELQSLVYSTLYNVK